MLTARRDAVGDFALEFKAEDDAVAASDAIDVMPASHGIVTAMKTP